MFSSSSQLDDSEIEKGRGSSNVGQRQGWVKSWGVRGLDEEEEEEEASEPGTGAAVLSSTLLLQQLHLLLQLLLLLTMSRSELD